MKEQPQIFNIENFSSEFRSLFDIYQKDCWEFSKYSRIEKKQQSELERLQNEIDVSMDKMVVLSAQALKKSKDKEFVMTEVEIIFFSKTTSNILSPGDMVGPRKIERFWKDVILKL